MAEKTRSEKMKETKEKKKQEEAVSNRETVVRSGLTRMLEFKHLFANPTRTFKVGDEVSALRAHWDNVEIIEVVEDGLFYRVKYGATENNYGKPIVSTSEAYVSWKDLISKDHKVATINLNKREELRDSYISFHNSHLESLFSKYYYFGVEMQPDYQRGLVWDQEDKEALIDSIFNGIEIGKFVFIHNSFEPGLPGFEILDGKQRLSTLIEFIEDRFTYKGVFYSQLSWEDRQFFNSFSITTGETRESLTPKQKYTYFLRLNTRGKAQSVDHLAKVQKLLDKEK